MTSVHAFPRSFDGVWSDEEEHSRLELDKLRILRVSCDENDEADLVFSRQVIRARAYESSKRLGGPTDPKLCRRLSEGKKMEGVQRL